MSDDRPSYGRSGEAIPGSDSIAPSLTSLDYYRDEAAPQVLNIPGAVYTECNSQIEAFAELGRVTMAGRKRVLRPDGSEDVSSQATSRPRRQGGGSDVELPATLWIEGDGFADEGESRTTSLVGSHRVVLRTGIAEPFEAVSGGNTETVRAELSLPRTDRAAGVRWL